MPPDASKLAQSAFQLWEASDDVLTKRRKYQEEHAWDGIERMEIIASGVFGVCGEVPKSWPCSFDEALRFVMPKKRTKADRHVLFRSFLKYAFQVRNSKKARGLKSNAQSEKQLLDEIEAAFKGFKQQGFSDREKYQFFLKPFCGWLHDLETQKISEQRTAAAKARWGEKCDTGGQAQSS